VTITTQYFSRSFACLHSIYVLYRYPPSLEKCIHYLSHDTVSESHKSTSRHHGTPEVGFSACTAPRVHSRRNVQPPGYLYKDPSDPSDPSRSAPSTPPVIEITTPRRSVHDPPSPPIFSFASAFASLIPRLHDGRLSSSPLLGCPLPCPL